MCIRDRTSAAVKNYVDTALTAEDLDITDGSNTGAIDLDSETLGILGGTGVDSALSGNNITLSIDNTVATLTGTQTLTNKTLTQPKLNGSIAVTTTGTELNILDGDTSASSVVIVDADQIILNDNGTMKQLAVTRLDTYVSGTKSGQTRTDHAKIKISDTVGDTRVYGVLASYSETDNKPVVASVGIGSIKVTGACSGGDLLESNGDGTAKVQSDDIVRSKTIGKVAIGNSDTGVKLVSCVLYCG